MEPDADCAILELYPEWSIFCSMQLYDGSTFFSIIMMIADGVCIQVFLFASDVL